MLGAMSDSNFLRGARVYLSGPMDFVASRADEKKLGWRNRVGDYLRAQGAIVFDPWFKPGVRGAHQYGLEDINTIDVRDEWTFEQGQAGDEKRSQCAEKFWETLHIDLRMVDTSDFTIAYVPTNIYSVGTVHEIVLSRLQWKPVLFVSPPVAFPALDLLRAHLEQRKDTHALQLLDSLSLRGADQAEPARHPEPLVHAAGREQQFFRRLRVCGIPGEISTGRKSRWTCGRKNSRRKTRSCLSSSSSRNSSRTAGIIG